MNAMERVLTAMQHKEPDRVPVYPIMAGVTRKLTGVDYPTWAQNAEACAEAFLKSAEVFDIDCLVTLIDLSIEVDAWGQPILFPEDVAPSPDYSQRIIKELEDFAKIKKVDYRTSKRMMMHINVCKKLVAAKGGKLPIIAFVFGPLGVLSMMRGQQDIFMDVYDDPDAVHEAARQINETLKDYCAALCDTGVDAIMFDTLFASASIMSPAMWDELEGDLVEELAQVVRDHGKQVMVHNCGAKVYFDEQIARMKPTAFSFALPPFGCENFAQAKEKYGDKLTLIGCVTPASAIVGSDENWDKECTDCMDAMAKGGGFMLATGCEYPAAATFDRAQRMIDLARTYGRYDK